MEITEIEKTNAQSSNQSNDLSRNVILKGIDKIYEVVINGSVPGTASASELAEQYLAKNETPLDAAKSLVRWQSTKAAIDGAITGLGGFLTTIVTLPVNVASVLFIQIRMVAAVAYISGVRDFKDDRLQIAIKCCLLDESFSSVVKNAGIEIAQKVTLKKLMPLITGKMLTKINQAVGFRLVTKFGTKGVINIGKGIPLLGAVVGAVFDGVTTKFVGKKAIKDFFDNETKKEIQLDK